MSKVWSHTRDGRAMPMVDPSKVDVDLRESCKALADINRYAGAAEQPVSVAFHTLLGFDICHERLRPWWLVHDFKEANLGDQTTPYKLAMRAVAEQGFPKFGGEMMLRTEKELERRHDKAIHDAAGLSMPTAEQIREIRAVDIRALKTERRDFLARCVQPWDNIVERAVPASHHYRAGEFGPTPALVGMKLFKRLTEYLPVYKEREEAVRANYEARQNEAPSMTKDMSSAFVWRSMPPPTGRMDSGFIPRFEGAAEGSPTRPGTLQAAIDAARAAHASVITAGGRRSGKHDVQRGTIGFRFNAKGQIEAIERFAGEA